MMTNTDRSDRIADAVENWHIKPTSWRGGEDLHDYLGWTWDDYARWVETGEPPPDREGSA